MPNPSFCFFLFEAAATNASRHKNNASRPKIAGQSKPFWKKLFHELCFYWIENLFHAVSVVENALHFTVPPVLICACNRTASPLSPRNFSRPCVLEFFSCCWCSLHSRKSCSASKRLSRVILVSSPIRSRIFSSNVFGTVKFHFGILTTTAACRFSRNGTRCRFIRPHYFTSRCH